MLPSFFKQWYDKAVEKIKELGNSNFVIKGLVISAMWILALIPCWITWGAWALISPETDLVRALIILGAIFVLGIPQLILIIASFFLSIALMAEDL